MDNAAFAEQFVARLGTDAAANPSGSQGGSDEALLQIDRKGGAVQFRKRSIVYIFIEKRFSISMKTIPLTILSLLLSMILSSCSPSRVFEEYTAEGLTEPLFLNLPLTGNENFILHSSLFYGSIEKNDFTAEERTSILNILKSVDKFEDKQLTEWPLVGMGGGPHLQIEMSDNNYIVIAFLDDDGRGNSYAYIMMDGQLSRVNVPSGLESPLRIMLDITD